MAFFQFRQNNSGGSFDVEPSMGIGHYVIVEAENAKEANERAQEIGIYFDGVDKGIDCECCGSRWCSCYEGEEGDEKPSVYGDEVAPCKPYKTNKTIYIHYKDGSFTQAVNV